jgi:hypothetical protein
LAHTRTLTHLDHEGDEVEVLLGLASQDVGEGHVHGAGVEQHRQLPDDQAAPVLEKLPVDAVGGRRARRRD